MKFLKMIPCQTLFIKIEIKNMLRPHLERKDGEGEDDDGGDPRRDDHCVCVVLHAHLVISMLIREMSFSCLECIEL